MAHVGGRPTRYDTTVLTKLDEYISKCGREATELPTNEGFAEYLDVDTDTLVDWKKKHKEFSVASKRLMDKQKNQLINDGLYGGKEVNPAVAIFLLKVNHGMMETDKHEIETRGSFIIMKPEKKPDGAI